MKRARLLLLPLIALLSATAAGCSRLPFPGPLPENLSAERIARIDEGSPFAVSPDGEVAAFVDAGLKLLRIATGERVTLSPKVPQQMAWSPGGGTLAVSYGGGERSTLVTYDRRGVRTAEAEAEGTVTDLAWRSEKELLAGAFVMARYRFGSNYKSVIHSWQPGVSAPAGTPLRDTTLRLKTTARWQPLLERGPMLDLDGGAGLILYMHPYDPPLFTPYYRLVLRELATGREMEIATLGLNAGGGRFSGDGETVLHGDGMARTTVYNPWTEETIGSLTGSGRDLALSPVGSYWFGDGALHLGDPVVATLSPGSRARFSADGKGVFVAAGTALYRLSGLRPERAAPRPEKVRQLRSWRIEGLISAKEYREAAERMKLP